MGYELTDFEWAAIRSFLPNKPRGIPRVDDRRVLNRIFWVLRSGAPAGIPWSPRNLLQSLCPLRQADVLDRIMDALAAGHDAGVQMIDASCEEHARRGYQMSCGCSQTRLLRHRARSRSRRSGYFSSR
jgi:transposase